MTHEEAISTLRNIYQTDKMKEALGILIPEFRESEDERMAEMAIKAVHSPQAQSCIKSWGVDPDDVIAWLEKQKKQKLTSFNEPYNPDDYEVVMEGNATSLRRKEQKPAEWSKEDEKMIEHIVGSLTSLKRYIQDNISFSEGIRDILKHDVERKQDWLKSLHPSWKPSGEQMRMLKCTIDYYGSHAPKELVSLYEQLKKL